jgi:hypothetical protein
MGELVTATGQLKIWTSEFGKECTNRNPIDIDKMDREFGMQI